jgi:hypothetical protein
MTHPSHDTPTPALAVVLPFPRARERLARRAIRELVEIRGETLDVGRTDLRDARIAGNRVLTQTGAVDRALATAKRVLARRAGGAA